MNDDIYGQDELGDGDGSYDCTDSTTPDPTPIKDVLAQYSARLRMDIQSGEVTRPQRTVVPRRTVVPSSAADSCPKCGGFGLVVRTRTWGHPDSGKVFPCECKEAERRERLHRQLYDASNLAAFDGKSFKNFETFEGNKDGLQMAWDFARALVDESAQSVKWLILRGGCGTGKTHLAAAIANFAISKGLGVYFGVVPDMLDMLRRGYDREDGVGYDEQMHRMKTVPLLVLDDYGTQSCTPWAAEKLFQIINCRYDYKRPMVVTTNCDLTEIPERTASRFCDIRLSCVVELTCGDYRYGA